MERTALGACAGRRLRCAALVPHDSLLLANSNLVEFLKSDQCVGHIAKGVLNSPLVGYQCLLML